MRTCLTTLLLVALALTSAMSARAESAATGAVIICPNCGHENPASNNFCGNCGANLENVPRIAIGGPSPAPGAEKKGSGHAPAHSTSALSDKPIPLQLAGFPERPKPIIEIGQNPFLGKGPIAPGYTIPTGAVWQPDFLVFGTLRTALSTFDNGDKTGQTSEWASRLDLFGNLYLTPTERILIGFRPLDRNGNFSGYQFDPQQKFQNDLNAYVTTIFFQGELDELFPRLDPNGSKAFDISFAIGRQPLIFEDGIMINEDMIDAVGITKTSLFFLGASSWRMTGVFGWGDLSRNNNLVDGTARLVGFFNTADYASDTVDLDFALVTASASTGGDGLYFGVGDTRRFGLINSTSRFNASWSLDQQTPAVSTGFLFFQQLSTTLPESKDVVYLDAFWGIRNYASAARGSDRGGPLGNTGILFAAQGLGGYGAPLGNRANDAVGAAIGFQKFIGGSDKQLVFEIGGRVATQDPQFFASSQPNSAGGAVRYEMKLNQHMVFIWDNFVAFPKDRETAYGFRTELLVKF